MPLTSHLSHLDDDDSSFSFDRMWIGNKIFVPAVSVLVLIELIISVSRQPSFYLASIIDHQFVPPPVAVKKHNYSHNAPSGFFDHGGHTITSNSYVAAVSSPYAYAFIVGGINPQHPSYRGYLYNILIAARILRKRGSQADIVAHFQMAYLSADDNLPAADVHMLQKLDIQIRYIEKSATESFYEAQVGYCFRISDEMRSTI